MDWRSVRPMTERGIAILAVIGLALIMSGVSLAFGDLRAPLPPARAWQAPSKGAGLLTMEWQAPVKRALAAALRT